MNQPPPAEMESPACPFVGFDDDRRQRSVDPDHRHRCYAESPPAPRAALHQEAYCLGAEYADCPTFQEWARRKASREARAAIEDAEAVAGAPAEGPRRSPVSGRRTYDWAAPPPWLADRRPAPDPDQLTAFDVLDGTPEEAPPARPPLRPPPPSPSRGDPALAALLRPATPPPVPEEEEGELPAFLTGGGGRPLAARPGRPAMVRPPTARPLSQARPAGSSFRRNAKAEPETPPWETPRHFEAYPPIRSRGGIGRGPGIIVAIVGLALAAIALVMLPSLLGSPSPSTTPRPSPTATDGGAIASQEPTAEPGPTQETYVVVANDTILRIANKLGVSVTDLLAANPDIKDPNLINVGDVINVPAPSTPEPLPGESASSAP